MKEQVYCVYMLTSPSGKNYIGLTSKFEKRMQAHAKPSNTCVAIRDAVTKYGFESFRKTILHDNLTLNEANRLEFFEIRARNTISPNGYNLRDGGNSGGTLSDETKAKLSEKGKGRIITEETRLALRLSHLGFIPTDTTKVKLKQNQIKLRLEKELPFYEKNLKHIENGTFDTTFIANSLNIQRCTLARRVREGVFKNAYHTQKQKGGKKYFIPIQDIHDFYTDKEKATEVA
jgi:group I intron endonuclease